MSDLNQTSHEHHSEHSHHSGHSGHHSSRKRKKGLKKWQKTLLIILGVLLLIFAAGILVINHYLGKINRVNTSTAESSRSNEELNKILESEYGTEWKFVPPETIKESLKAPEAFKESTKAPETSGESLVVPTTAATGSSELPPIIKPSRVPRTTEAQQSTEENEEPSGEEYEGDDEPAAPAIDWNWYTAPELEDEGLINILLVGMDGMFSDAIILCSVNPWSHDIKLISFMRDVFVPIGDYGTYKLNTAFAIGGLGLLEETLENLYGIHIDGGAYVDFSSFVSVVNALGGVDINLSEEEAKIIGGKAKAGKNHLSGGQTLTYVRIRKIGYDFERTERQRTVLTAIFNKLKSADLATLNNTLNTVLPLVTTDLSNGEIVSIAADVLPYLKSSSLDTDRIPHDGTYVTYTISGQVGLLAVQSWNLYYLREMLPY